MKVVAVGDIGVHGRHADLARSNPEAIAAPTRVLFKGADVVLGNLEIPIGEQRDAPGPAREGPPLPATGAAPAESARLLRSWGFTHISLANNHIMDLGDEGLKETIARLLDAGIVPFGAGMNEDEASRPVRLDGDPPLALLGYSMRCKANARADRAGSAPFRPSTAAQAIRGLADEGRTVIVALHMGRMYLRRPVPQHLRIARGLLDAGATIVLCHHAHVPAGMLKRGGRVAALGLGDFLFDAYQGEIRTIVGRRSRTVGMCLSVGIERTGITALDRSPLLLPREGGPTLHPHASRIMRQWGRWDREMRLPDPVYAGIYYLFEYPRLIVYIGHAALIHACRRNWGRVYAYTLGLLVGRLTRGGPRAEV